jgi:hypothetical protein
VSRIHPVVFGILGLWLVGQIISWIKGPAFIESVAVIPSAFSPLDVVRAIPFHESFFSTLASMLYFWVFGPAIFEFFKGTWITIASIGATVLTLWLFSLVHASAGAPVLSSDAFLGFYLGAFMRKDIWGTVDTLVVGPFWIKVFSVPSYVLLFFWFFYLLIGNLIMDPPFSDAPMLYLIPLVGFLVGFAYASIPKTSVQL